MNSRNYLPATDSMKVFKICSLAIFIIFGSQLGLLAEGTFQEVVTTGTDALSSDHKKPVSRATELEMRLKSLERRLQALEGKASTDENVEPTTDEKTSPSPSEDQPSLNDLEQHLEILEKRLAEVEKAKSSKEGAPTKHSLTRQQDGFYLYSDEDAGFQMRLGGGLQVDYRYYGEQDRADDRFDIRRARLNLSGRLFHLLGYRASYDFQGNDSKNLLDAYGEIGVYGPNILRFGQFKVPFSLQQQTSYKDMFFAERSMGFFLSPMRDVGLGLRGHFLQDAVNYAVGVFNGDGTDGSSWGSQQDDPMLAGRFVVAPFKTSSLTWLSSFQIGGSATYENIDLSNVDVDVKSTGMVGTNRSLYMLNSNTKFGVLHGAGDLLRADLEAAWTIGPLTLQGEYIRLKYTDLKDASGSSRDADFSSWYGSAVFWLTGEHRNFLHGIPRSIKPIRNFNPSLGDWGAFGLGCRVEHFSGDPDWITEDAFVSVRKADAFSGALNWILNPAFALILDYTYTDLSDPIRVRVNPDGTVDYIDEEHVLTIRSQLVF